MSTSTRTMSRLALLVVCAWTNACGAPAPKPSPAPVPTPAKTVAAPPPDRLSDDSSFQTIVSTRFDFALPLPDSSSFQIDDVHERWFVATHQPSGSTLLIRKWREYDIVDRRVCEERARLHRTLPERDRAAPIEERRIDVPPGHDTIVDVRVREQARAPRYEGQVLAFGGWAHQCFAFVFVTKDDDETTVADRLSTIVHGSLEHLKFQSDLDPKRTPPDLKTPLRLDPAPN